MIKKNIKLTIKKVICISSISACMMSIVACGKEDVPEPSELNNTTAETVELTTDFTTSEEETEEDITEEVSTEADADEIEYKIGVIDGNTYTNETFGFSFELPDGWTFFDDETLYQYGGLDPTNKSDESAKEYLDNLTFGSGGFYVDVYGINEATSSTINVGISVSDEEVTSIDKNELIEELAEGYVPELESQGFTVNSIEADNILIDGISEPIVIADLSVNGVQIYECQYYIFNSNYMCIITIADIDRDEMMNLLQSIKRN